MRRSCCCFCFFCSHTWKKSFFHPTRVFCDGFAIPSEAEAGFEGFCDEFATPSEAQVGFEGFCDEFATPSEAKLGFDISVASWGGWIYIVLHCFVHEEWIPSFQKPHLHGVCLLLLLTHILCFERWASKLHLHGFSQNENPREKEGWPAVTSADDLSPW